MLSEQYFALNNYVPEYGMKVLDFLHISTYQENELFQDMQGFVFWLSFVNVIVTKV